MSGARARGTSGPGRATTSADRRGRGGDVRASRKLSEGTYGSRTIVLRCCGCPRGRVSVSHSRSWKHLPFNARTLMHPFTAKTMQITQLGPTSCPPSDWPVLSRSTRIDLLRGMLERLKDATPSGRHYLIAKVLTVLRREAFDSGDLSDLTDRQMIVQSMEQLEREASRVAPDPHIFEHTAWILVEKLAFETPAK